MLGSCVSFTSFHLFLRSLNVDEIYTRIMTSNKKEDDEEEEIYILMCNLRSCGMLSSYFVESILGNS